MREPVRRDAVTCQNRSSSTTPSRPARPASPVGERAVDQQMPFGLPDSARRATPRLQQRKVVQQRQPASVTSLPVLNMTQAGLSLQRRDRAVAGRRSHQVHVLESIAKSQMAHAGIGDAALPGHLESAQSSGRWRRTSRPRSVSLPPGYSLRSSCAAAACAPAAADRRRSVGAIRRG